MSQSPTPTKFLSLSFSEAYILFKLNIVIMVYNNILHKRQIGSLAIHTIKAKVNYCVVADFLSTPIYGPSSIMHFLKITWCVKHMSGTGTVLCFHCNWFSTDNITAVIFVVYSQMSKILYKVPLSAHWAYNIYTFIDQSALSMWCGQYHQNFSRSFCLVHSPEASTSWRPPGEIIQETNAQSPLRASQPHTFNTHSPRVYNVFIASCWTQFSPGQSGSRCQIIFIFLQLRPDAKIKPWPPGWQTSMLATRLQWLP